MEIHRFEKLWLGVSLLLVVGFISTVAYGAVGPGIAMVDDSGGTIEAATVADGEFDATDNFREPGVYRTGEDRYDVYVVARQFLFEPGTSEAVEIPAGSTVTFHVTSADVTHGFQLVGTNVNTMVIPGQVASVTARFESTDSYGMVCHEYCGAGHHTMAGQVRVLPAGEFEQAHDVTAAGRVVPADGAGTGSGSADVAADATTTDDDGDADANGVN